MLTVEELLRPRYKVIADYPKSVYEAGTIINAGTTSEDCIYCDREGPRMRHYPHLFQPLPWWSDRKVEEMPAFIKCDERVWKITEWRKDIIGRFFPMNEVDTEGESENFANIKWHFASDKFLPATREEYEAFKQQK